MRALGSPLDDAEKALVYAEARACIGIKWRHMGRAGLPYGHQTGLDCVGYLIRIVAACGRPVGDIDIYLTTGDGKQLRAEMDRQLGAQVNRTEIHAGCIVMLMLGRENPHVGILVGRSGILYLIHCYSPYGVVEHRLDDAWRKRIVAGWAL